MSRRAWAVVALAIVVVSAGCGGARSRGGDDTAATPGTVRSGVNSTATTRAKAMKFAECMRANGVGAFPDPDVEHQLEHLAVALRCPQVRVELGLGRQEPERQVDLER